MSGDYSGRDRTGPPREFYGSTRDRGEREHHRDRERTRDHDRESRRGGDRDRDHDRDRERRRRSRSPREHRGSRREHEGSDAYSSSRDYREREREDRYGGRDRRGEWDRDRGSARRDARRGDDDARPHARRDRDLFDDRRGGGGGGGRRDREMDMNSGGRGKEASPPPKKREPTPDLTDVVPVLERKRRMTGWDIKPPGYENFTAEQAKLSGMFPLPGAPRQQAVDPGRIQAMMRENTGQTNSTALRPSNAKQARRLFVHGLPPNTTDQQLVDFFNLHLNGLNTIRGVDPCTAAMMSTDRTYALLEFKNSEDATMALALDGIEMEDDTAMNGHAANGGAATGLKISRPKDYIVTAIQDDSAKLDGVTSSEVPDTQNKLCLANLAENLTDDNIMDLLKSFGELRSFIMAKDRSTEQSRGIAFFEYSDPAATEVALAALNGMDLADRQMRITRASIGLTQASGLEMSVNAMTLLAGTTSEGLERGRVLQLLNMVTPEELLDPQDVEEITEDVQDECSKYGTVLNIKIPRPTGGARTAPGVGKIFVKYDTPESAQKAFSALAGRKFAERTVVVTFFGEDYFDVGAF